jgi:hypothetical protein
MPIACLALLLWADVSLAQTFISEGPAPRFGPVYASQSADAAPNGTEAGAIQAILPDPALGASTIFAASPNGGIFVTTNNGATWKPLTDNQASLSIASLGLDPTDPTGKTIIAGVGVTDNVNTASSIRAPLQAAVPRKPESSTPPTAARLGVRSARRRWQVRA